MPSSPLSPSPSVAVFVNQHMPLSEVFVANQVKALQRYKPHLVACRTVSPSVIHPFPVTAVNKTGGLSDRIQELLFKATGYHPTVDAELKKHDLIHAHFGPTGWMVAPAAKRLGKPLVVTLHGFDVLKQHMTVADDGLFQVLYHKTLPRMTEATSRFICVSEFLKKKAVAFGIPEEKCLVHYMGIPLTPHSEPKVTHAGTEDDPFRILAVGRLVEMKGHRKLIEAVAEVRQAGYHIHLDIVGAGPLREDLEHLAEKSLKSFTFWGGQPHSNILALMRRSDIFCHTSHTIANGQTEAFGLVVSEAQWCGLPVVAFESGGVPEAVEKNVTALLAPEGDAKAFARHVITLLADPALRERMSAAAPDFIRSHFDNFVQTAKLEAIYDEVLTSSGKL